MHPDGVSPGTACAHRSGPGTERTRSGANAVQNLNGLALDGLDKRAQQVQVDAKEAVPDKGPRAGQDLDAWDAGDSKDAAARSLP